MTRTCPCEMGRSWACSPLLTTHQSGFAPATQFLTDLTTGNLPAVAEIDPGFAAGLDEHAGVDPNAPSGRIQTGSKYVSTLINALMKSPYWKDSVFILTWDEGGGFYDHVPPQSHAQSGWNQAQHQH